MSGDGPLAPTVREGRGERERGIAWVGDQWSACIELNVPRHRGTGGEIGV